MESYYSSDDEIAWGPLTLREIKKDLQRPPRKLKHRESDSGYFLSAPKELVMDQQQLSSRMEENKSDASTSVYFTPNDTSSTSKTDNFIQKLHQFINEPASASEPEASTYVSAVDVSPIRPGVADDTMMNIIKTARDSQHLDNIQQTLIENTINISSDADCSATNNQFECSTIYEDSIVSDEEQVIVISDEDITNTSVYEDQPVPYNIKVERSVNDENCEKDDTDDQQPDQVINSIQDKLTSFNISGVSSFHQSLEPNILNFLNETSDSEAGNSCNSSLIQTESNKSNGNVSVGIQSSCNYSFEENLGQTDLQSNTTTSENCSNADSCKDKSDGEMYCFNDTLEEMEMALKQGLDYVMFDEEQPIKTESSPCINHQLTPVHQAAKPKQHLTKSAKKYDYVQSPVGDYIKRKSPINDQFKIPMKPVKAKLTPNTKSQNDPYRNIVSPVSIYIKNSPGICLKQNMQTKTVPSIKITMPPTTTNLANKENVADDLPQVVYKSAKKTVTSTTKDVVLPSSIQKMVQEPIITKHMNRVKHTDLNSVSRKLLEDDLTSIDNTLLDNSNDDVSFLAKKQAFIK